LKGEDGEMKHRTFFNNQCAVAGVIEALLMVALVAIILSFIQLYYVPEIMKDREADHMDQVSNQFSNLKSVIEIQERKSKIYCIYINFLSNNNGQ